ncbi:hypothetical protein Hanom_Chr05g00410541 [Helianthus anomalus]
MGSKPSITTSGGNSDGPTNLGDELRCKELTDKVSKLESFVDEIIIMLKILVQNSKPPPTNAELAEKVWFHAQSYLQLQKQSAHATHNIHMEMIRNMIEARYNDTQAEIKAVKDHILQAIGTIPTPRYPTDEAKKGESSNNLRKLPSSNPTSTTKKAKVSQTTDQLPQTSIGISKVSTYVTATLTILLPPIPRTRKRKTITSPIRSYIKTTTTSHPTSSPPSSSLPSANPPRPDSIKEYLELKRRQAKRMVLESYQGKDDKQLQQNLLEEYRKVDALQGYATIIYRNLSHNPITNADLKKLLRKDYINHIMEKEPYNAERRSIHRMAN